MNLTLVIETFNRHEVRFLLIGGMNFLLRHKPVLTFDIDVWIEDTDANRRWCEQALCALDAQWGMRDDDWGPVQQKAPGWLGLQGIFCLTSPAGAIDVFRAVKGLNSWADACRRAETITMSGNLQCKGLCDADMLACQEALDDHEKKMDRIRELKRTMGIGDSRA